MQEGSKGGEEIIALFGTTKICPRSEQNRRKEGPSAAASECESNRLQAEQKLNDVKNIKLAVENLASDAD